MWQIWQYRPPLGNNANTEINPSHYPCMPLGKGDSLLVFMRASAAVGRILRLAAPPPHLNSFVARWCHTAPLLHSAILSIVQLGGLDSVPLQFHHDLAFDCLDGVPLQFHHDLAFDCLDGAPIALQLLLHGEAQLYNCQQEQVLAK